MLRKKTNSGFSPNNFPAWLRRSYFPEAVADDVAGQRINPVLLVAGAPDRFSLWWQRQTCTGDPPPPDVLEQPKGRWFFGLAVTDGVDPLAWFRPRQLPAELVPETPVAAFNPALVFQVHRDPLPWLRPAALIEAMSEAPLPSRGWTPAVSVVPPVDTLAWRRAPTTLPDVYQEEVKAAQAAQPWLTPPQESLAWRRVASTTTPPEPEFQPRALWTPPLTPQPVVDSLAWLQRRWRIEEAILEVVAGQFPMGTLPTPAIVIAGPYWIARQQVVVGGPVRGQGLWT